MDPFCGCGTAIAASQKLGRKWIGIDITHLSIALQKYRLKSMFPGLKFEVIGEPADLSAARQLASQDRYQFQWWALSLVHAKPLGGQVDSRIGREGKDRGIDGVIPFIENMDGELGKVIVQVKSGRVSSGYIRDLSGTIEREHAAIGIFITLEEPTREMKTEAISAGFHRSNLWNKDYPKLQIYSVEELMNGADLKIPPGYDTFKQAKRTQEEVEQTKLFEDQDIEQLDS